MLDHGNAHSGGGQSRASTLSVWCRGVVYVQTDEFSVMAALWLCSGMVCVCVGGRGGGITVVLLCCGFAVERFSISLY